LFPGARFGTCRPHALNKLAKTLTAITSLVCTAVRSQFHPLLYQARQRTPVRVLALGQRFRHCADHGTTAAGAATGQRGRQGFQEKQEGWYAVLIDSPMPVTSTRPDQVHNAIARPWFMMQGFHHPHGSQQTLLHGLAHL
jgi:hypothetical protein